MQHRVMVLASLWAILGTPLLCPSGLLPCCGPTAADPMEQVACAEDCNDVVPADPCECPCTNPTPSKECPICIVTCAPLTMLDAGPHRPCLEPTCMAALAPHDRVAIFVNPTAPSRNDPFASGNLPDGPPSGSLPLLI